MRLLFVSTFLPVSAITRLEVIFLSQPGPNSRESAVFVRTDVPSGSLRPRPAAEIGRRSIGRGAGINRWAGGAKVVIAAGVSYIVHKLRVGRNGVEESSRIHQSAARIGVD